MITVFKVLCKKGFTHIRNRIIYWTLQVTTLGRRESKIQNDKLDHKIVDFDALPEGMFNDHDVAICTLGNQPFYVPGKIID